MASEQTALNVMGNALWDPHPTKSDLRARQLAVALGYPLEWRVVRTMEPMEIIVVDDDDGDGGGGGGGMVDDKKPTTTTTSTATNTDKVTTKETETVPAVAATAAMETPQIMIASSSSSTTTKAAKEAATNASETAPATVAAATAPVAAEPETTSPAAAASAPVPAPTQVATTTPGPAESTSVAVAVADSVPEATPTEAVSTAVKAPEAVVSVTNQPDTKAAMSIATDSNEANKAKPAATAPPASEIESAPPAETKPTTAKSSKSPDETKSSDNKSKKRLVSVIVDRIYAGKPGTGCDMWVHHEAAMKAAQAWIIHGTEQDEENAASSKKGPTPFDHRGGHLLPRLPRFAKGDKVQVLYEDEWWDARILRRREHAEAGFRYQVQYVADHSKQSGVEEDLIRPIKADTDALATAASIGLVEGGWKAYVDGHHKWKIEAPDGTIYRSKRAALDAYAREYKQPQVQEVEDLLVEEGDPPWRMTGHDYLGRHVLFVQHHQVSVRRSVRVEQIGKVTGWISETDVDKAGEPGFVSEKTGAPAPLFHVVFDDEPNHPYSSMLVQSQDLEEYELLECLLSEEEYRPPKKARKR